MKASIFLGPITLLVSSLTVSLDLSAQTNSLQLKFNDSISVYSEKAYKRNKGQLFEAIGNVVILNGENTLYGEKASINLADGAVNIEGNVRYISSDITVYGSKIFFNSVTRELDIENARVVTSEFNIVANSLRQTAENKFHAIKAQFTTCKDCTESWAIYGEDIYVEIGQYVQIFHALAKIKGVSVLYFPYIALPIKTTRESGLLFPRIYSTLDEGVAYEQPYFLDLGRNKDMTFTPRLLGKRGYGLDYEYRHIFKEKNWYNLTNRSIVDSIYLPMKTSTESSGEKYFRNFLHFESHIQGNNNLTSHIEVTRMKDFDMISDFADYLNDYIHDTDIGSHFFVDYRTDGYFIGLEAAYRRNMLFDNAREFDEQYIQTLPSLSLSLTPKMLMQSDRLFFQKMSWGIDTDITRFAQSEEDETILVKNATRVSTEPYLDWHWFDVGSVHFKTRYSIDLQSYKLHEQEMDHFTKSAQIFRTEASFAVGKTFGAAKVSRIRRKSALREKEEKDSDLIGHLPSLNADEDLDFESIFENSYRHTQEFRFIHHYISASHESGNTNFLSQIKDDAFWFDYDDALKKDVATIGLNDIRTQIPVLNTFEFQWNNSLVRKSVSLDREGKPVYSFNKIGYFDLSQGVVLNDGDFSSLKDRLTRLYLGGGYRLSDFNISFKDYFFHNSSNHKLDINSEHQFDNFSLLSRYAYNSIDDSKIETIGLGARAIPIDTLGISYLQDYDLKSGESIKTEYQLDFMPLNNCWILNLKYRKNVIDERYSVNFVFNFGSGDFDDFRRDYFRFN